KKLLLAISLIVNLGLLGFFKYYDFFAGSLAALLHIPKSSVVLQIILPVGISFYTFASLSYTFDVYWGKMKAVRNFIDYALFIAFFPHLIAGPIIRARQFISQIPRWQRPATIVVQSGIILVLSGLLKKMVFADRFAVVADSYFRDPMAHPGWLAAWSGCLAFFMQVFFDFSGYTDIARGCAKLLGFEFPLNFARPFLSRNPPDLWQRWHITLSTWVRDYLFMPFSRGRKGRFVLYSNMVVVMVLVGLWHGANWTFVVWGAYHGLLLIGYRLFDRATVGTAIDRVMKMRWFVPFSVGLMFSAFVLSAAFFRPKTLQTSGYVLSALFGFQHVTGEFLLTTGTIVLIFISLFLAVAGTQPIYRSPGVAAGARSNTCIRIGISGARTVSRNRSGAVCLFPILSSGLSEAATANVRSAKCQPKKRNVLDSARNRLLTGLPCPIENQISLRPAVVAVADSPDGSVTTRDRP